MFAVQTITISWTKASRGGRLAVLRNRLPTRLLLPQQKQVPGVLWHSVVYTEINEFSEPISDRVTTEISNNSFGCSNAEIELNENNAVLTYRYRTGAPSRQFFDKTGKPTPPEHAIKIKESEWASLQYNNRFSCMDTGNWWYEQAVINVAVGTEIPPDVYLVTAPLEQYSQLVHLR